MVQHLLTLRFIINVSVWRYSSLLKLSKISTLDYTLRWTVVSQHSGLVAIAIYSTGLMQRERQGTKTKPIMWTFCAEHCATPETLTPQLLIPLDNYTVMQH